MKNFKTDIPTLKYSGDSEDKKTPLSIRLPEPLLERLKEISEEKGLTMTFLVQIVLDQYAQQAGNKK